MSLYPQHASLPLAELPGPDLEEPEKLFYGGPDDEAFSASSPEEYLQSLFEDDPRASFEELYEMARRRGDVEVCAYRRRQVEPEMIQWWANDAWDTFVEKFEEEFGGDDSCLRNGVDHSVAKRMLAPVLERLAKRLLVVWQCEEVSRRTYSVNEVLAVLGWNAPAGHPLNDAVVPVHHFARGGA